MQLTPRRLIPPAAGGGILIPCRSSLRPVRCNSSGGRGAAVGLEYIRRAFDATRQTATPKRTEIFSRRHTLELLFNKYSPELQCRRRLYSYIHTRDIKGGGLRMSRKIRYASLAKRRRQRLNKLRLSRRINWRHVVKAAARAARRPPPALSSAP
ncbi:hypothetical protein EVAR_49601_1 [Eumeta japonica]|uniref:Uncharacterized protein n=1 Tax=Eumeta variegata TaxID=151549 RepID=A0A4C1Y2V7_EUMVA|nr:hypothetical protein EVAR_49601_1 [Eumeta japonica]